VHAVFAEQPETFGVFPHRETAAAIKSLFRNDDDAGECPAKKPFRGMCNTRGHLMRRSSKPQNRSFFLPRLEALEDRIVPDSVLVGNAAQIGSQLVVGVFSTGISTTLIVQDGLGDVAVAWNGFNFNFFSGVDSIQLNSQGQGNLIDLYSLQPLQIQEQLNLSLTGAATLLLVHLPAGGVPLVAQANVPVPFITI
jgi:hypothetical protein